MLHILIIRSIANIMKSCHLLQTQTVDTLDVHARIDSLMHKLETTTASDLISELMDKAIAFGLKILAAIVIYLIGIWVIRKIKKIVARILEKSKADAAISSFVLSIVSIVLTAILIMTTISALGVDTTSIAALLAGGGVAIGLALNGAVQNFAGGIMIIIFKPFKIGDYIEAQGHAGTVAEVNIVSTELLTADNKRIIIPNGALSGGTINNYSEMSYRRVEWNISVEYGSQLEPTKAAIMSLLEGNEKILTSAQGAPASPFVALASLDNSSIRFTARAWVKSEDYWDVFFYINERIYTELPKEGINFPFPQLDVHVHQDKA